MRIDLTRRLGLDQQARGQPHHWFQQPQALGRGDRGDGQSLDDGGGKVSRGALHAQGYLWTLVKS